MSYRNGIIAAAAALAMGAATAMAQPAIKFETPFAFTTLGARLMPGSYELAPVRLLSSTPVYRLTNVDTGRSVALTAMHPVSRSHLTVRGAEVTFYCAYEGCALAAFYGPASAVGLSLPVKVQHAAVSDQKFA